MLLGYLPVGKFDHIIDDDERREARHRLFHECMAILLQHLKEAGRTGVYMRCADSSIRRIYPLVAMYVADYPEQCLIAGTQESRCPICMVSYKDRPNLQPEPILRTSESTLPILAYRARHGLSSKDFIDLGLRPIWPFWANLPHCSIFETFSPDVLHQLHKGLFKDHLVKWCTMILGSHAVDARFSHMPEGSCIRHFHNGISHLKQTTGKEHREMEKVFVGVLAGSHARVIKAARALLDFIYISHYSSITESDLNSLHTALVTFHNEKDVFTNCLGQYGFEGIAKLHAVEHYIFFIRKLGVPDGSSSEPYEHSHINFAKEGYAASNRVKPLKQMTIYLQRKDAIRLWTSHLAFITGFAFSETKTDDMDFESDTFDPDISATEEPDADDLMNTLHLPTLPTFSQPLQPSPSIAIAARAPASSTRKRLDWVQDTILSSSLINSINTFLGRSIPSRFNRSSPVSYTDEIDLWTRFRLLHAGHRLPNLDITSKIIEVVHAQLKPPCAGLKASTALILVNPDAAGLCSELKFFISHCRSY